VPNENIYFQRGGSMSIYVINTSKEVTKTEFQKKKC